ncbi:gamma-glutamyl-gamma-aminobutyrate hydrolase family protein [Leucobacter soli]|uniref:gamma-glutamyl-gamma-aminobutyrate hydrolase family protein n=1 Tax=Leucobacter soli TaxID=2812850 RepID=UPI00361B7BC1
MCDEADAVLFLGGGDVDVRCYGYTGPEPRGYYGVDADADRFCLDLIRESVRRDLPVLALCRGSQLLNVAYGGTLIPDIEDWRIHRGPGGDELMIDEALTLEPDSRIAAILGRTEAIVRNGHHQAVDRVGEELRPVAFAADGIVEATEHRSASWVVGVQWHPEEAGADVADRHRIFDAFVEQGRGDR